MRLKRLLPLVWSALIVVFSVLSVSASWKITDRIQVGGEGGWDYLTVDAVAHRLFLSHAKKVVVIDLKTKKILGSIVANGVHGIALAPDLNRGFFSNGTDNTVTGFDLTSLKITSTLSTGIRPDAICYESKTHRIFAFNGGSNTATVVDAAREKVIGEIPLGGRPEFAVGDGQGYVYNALEDKGQLLKINAATQAIEARWSLPAESEPSGLALDAAQHRLFIGCGNQTLIVLDAISGQSIATLPIGQGVDACVYDPLGHRAFASCGDGTLTVIQQKDKDTYVVTEKATTEPRARTMAFDPGTNTAYLPDAQFGPPAPATPEHPKPRPTILPNSLELLIVKPSH